MRNKMVLVDGHNLLFQMHFGIQNKFYLNEMEVHGAYGFISAILKIARIIEPTHFLVFFDSETSLFRKDSYSDYKENRIDYSLEDDNPFTQLEIIYEYLKKIDINYLIVENIEADDMIASYSKRYENEADIYIVSNDTDFYQLLNKNIFIFRYKGENSFIVDEEYIKKKLNIYAKDYVRYKAMVGDSADNIKGIYRVGPKTAAKIINENLKIDEDYQSLYERNIDLIQFKIIDIKNNIDEFAYEKKSISSYNLFFKKEVI